MGGTGGAGLLQFGAGGFVVVVVDHLAEGHSEHLGELAPVAETATLAVLIS